MSDRTFVFREDDASAVEDAFTSMAKKVRSEATGLSARLQPTLADWTKESASRQAQMRFDSKMLHRAEELASALDTAATAMANVRNLAHDAEVRNVAVLD